MRALYTTQATYVWPWSTLHNTGYVCMALEHFTQHRLRMYGSGALYTTQAMYVWLWKGLDQKSSSNKNHANIHNL